MGTLFLYVVVIVVVGALLFIVTAALFGRSEELEPLPKGVSPTVLPAADIRGDDVRAVRLRLRFRGYDQHDVDWTLARLADRLDELDSRIVALESYESGRRTDGSSRVETDGSSRVNTDASSQVTADGASPRTSAEVASTRTTGTSPTSAVDRIVPPTVPGTGRSFSPNRDTDREADSAS